MRLATLVVVVHVLVAIGCREPAVKDCQSRLAGIWTNEAGDRFHVTDDGRSVEIFRLSPGPSDAEDRAGARVVQLERFGQGLSGFAQRFVSRGPRICRVRSAARVQGCKSTSLVLLVASAGELDFETCQQQADGNEKALTLSRIRALP